MLPEYALNVAATRYGYDTYSGAQMATFHLAFGVVGVALVSDFVLGERLTTRQVLGFSLLAAGTVLIRPRHLEVDRPLVRLDRRFDGRTEHDRQDIMWFQALRPSEAQAG